MEAHGMSLDEALARETDRRRDDVDRPGWWELVSLAALVVAGTGLPIVGWLVGLTMVHLSEVWTAADKRIATVSGLVAAAAAVIASVFVGDTGVVLLDLGPLAVLVLLGGGIAGWVGGAYLTWRAFELA